VRPFLPLVIAMLAVALCASAQFVNWVQYINPTNERDRAYGVCLFGEYLAVVGEAEGTPRYRYVVALLNRTTGEVKTWVSEYGGFYNCLSVGDRLYVVEYKGVYIFDTELNVVKRVETDWYPQVVTFDGSYLYLAGFILRDVDGDGDGERIWRIEKRTLDLDLVAYREFYREWDKTYDYFSEANDIAVNPATGELWAVGVWGLVNRTTRIVNLEYSLLVIFDKELNVKRVVEYPEGHENSLEELFGICFDEEGNAYVAGWDGVAKFDKNGELLAVNREVGRKWKIACVGGRVYVFGGKSVGDYWPHVLYVFDEDLNLLGAHILSKGVEADSWFSIGKLAFDGRNLYVAGYDEALGKYNTRMVVYSVKVIGSTAQPSLTIMSPPTTPPPPTDFLIVGVVVAVAAVVGVLAAARLRGRGAEALRAQQTTRTVPRPRVGEGDAGDFCLEYQGGIIPLSSYTVVGRGDFSGLPDWVLEMVEERHFVVYFKDGVWWVEDLGSRHGTYLNGVRVKKERLREGDVVSPGAAVAVVFIRCGTTRRVVPMEEEGTKTY